MYGNEVKMFYKRIEQGYIISIGTGKGGTEITEAEYNSILDVIRSKPHGTDTEDYRLKEDLTWEAYPIEPVPYEPTAEELLDILTGEAE